MKTNFSANIINFKTIDSTNNYLKLNYEKLPSLSVIKSEYQTDGYGKLKSSWEANQGDNLLFSLLIKENLGYCFDELNTKIIESVILTLNKYHIEAYFKVPNDVYVIDKKIAGILIETKFNQTYLDYIIIGIGLNVNQESFITPKAISMKNILKRKLPIDAVFTYLINLLSVKILGE